MLKETLGAASFFSKRKTALSGDRVGYVLIAPFYIFLAVFIVVPIVMNLYLSFTDYDFQRMSFVGWDNYEKLLHDSFFLISVKNTFVYTFFTLIFTMGLGLLFAEILNSKLFGVKWFRTSLFLPYVTSMVAVSMVWLWMYEPSHGVLNVLLDGLGLPKIKWLYDTRYALLSIVIMSVWKFIGYNMVIYLAGLQGIPKDLYESASVDGAGAFRQFWNITLPMLKPVTFFLVVTGLINNFNVFEQIQILTNGGPMNSTTTIVHQIYNRAFNEFQLGYAASMAIVLLGIIALITIANFKYGNQSYDG